MILGLKQRKFKMNSEYLDQERNKVLKDQKDMTHRLKCFLMFKPGAIVSTKINEGCGIRYHIIVPSL